ncbi:hypothetical protein O3P69_002715 [Scylla paramamosain]|uniref:Uncharacterized protein n=1 Tax=Scylla paramamosain TaxID=85552 RepID=A0AAW0ULY4_SCYPA
MENVLAGMEERGAEGRYTPSFFTCPSRERGRVAGGRGRKEGSRVTADSVQTSVKVGGVVLLRLLAVTRYLFVAKEGKIIEA